MGSPATSIRARSSAITTRYSLLGSYGPSGDTTALDSLVPPVALADPELATLSRLPGDGDGAEPWPGEEGTPAGLPALPSDTGTVGGAVEAWEAGLGLEPELNELAAGADVEEPLEEALGTRHVGQGRNSSLSGAASSGHRRPWLTPQRTTGRCRACVLPKEQLHTEKLLQGPSLQSCGVSSHAPSEQKETSASSRLGPAPAGSIGAGPLRRARTRSRSAWTTRTREHEMP